MCNKFSTLLDLEGAVETVLVKGHNLANAFTGVEQGISCSARRSSSMGMVVSETSSGKYVKRKVAPTGQISRRDKSWDKIMRRYDHELLGAPLWCTTQQEEGLWIQGVNVVVPQRRVFMCASKLALAESLSHQHMGAVYHRGRSLSASTSESHGGGRDHVNIKSCWELHFGEQCNGKKGCGFKG
ncbi:hypothetical protein B296_00043389 [Ensete ventricosum]|uniref:Uncharacterized protein n=1 Tax=Ensete ventricosum TaxID=4639 RepID=A0A426YQT5_ENSVE|nr:hypothetical protein B296_00043389 [Ensete ventricosum]